VKVPRTQTNIATLSNNCLEVIGRLVDIGGIVDNNCLEVIGRFVDIGGIIDHNCLEVIGHFVDIGGIVDHHCLNFIFIKEKGLGTGMQIRFVNGLEVSTLRLLTTIQESLICDVKQCHQYT
jgi:hypothetical protein